MKKNAVEPVKNKESLWLYNRLFLVPKPNNQWRPIVDLSNLNKFLKVEKFKMETPETIRTSLHKEEWVTSVDFKDAYFHIPIQEQSRKYLRFHIQSQIYQFKALPFGLFTAPMEFTVLAKEVKLMVIHKGIRIHQYLDVWLVRARSHQNLSPAFSGTSSNMCEPRLAGEFRKIRVGPQTTLRLCRLPVRPQVRLGLTDTRLMAERPTNNTGTAILTGLSGPAIHIFDRSTNSHRKASSPRPTTYRPIQWHFKNNWRVPESLGPCTPI